MPPEQDHFEEITNPGHKGLDLSGDCPWKIIGKIDPFINQVNKLSTCLIIYLFLTRSLKEPVHSSTLKLAVIELFNSLQTVRFRVFVQKRLFYLNNVKEFRSCSKLFLCYYYISLKKCDR